VTPDCPAGATCTIGKYCSKITYSNEGGSCEIDGNCKSGLVCLYLNALGSGICRVPCDPIEDAGCAEGKGCFWVYDTETQERQGGCIADKGGGLAGATCGPGQPVCAPHLICVDLPEPDDGYCARDCLRSTGAGCPNGECVELANAVDPDQGACLVDPDVEFAGDVVDGDVFSSTGDSSGSSPEVGGGQADSSTGPAINMDALGSRRPRPSGDVIIYVPGGIKPHVESGGSGCSSGSGAGAPVSILLTVLFAFVVRRWRRTPYLEGP